MPRKKKKPLLIKIALWCWRHPHQLLERSMLGLLAVMLVMMVWTLGGFVAAGTGLLCGTWLVSLLLLLFGMWWLSAAQARMFAPWSLAFAPWIIYLAVNWLYISPAPWRAQLHFSMWAQAAAVFFVCCHVFRSKKDSLRLLTVLVMAGFVAVILGLYQYYIRPGWLPLGQEQSPLLLESASGSFPTPAAFAGFLLLLFPLTLAIAAMRRFPMPLRIGSGVLFLVLLSGIVISASKGAWISAAVILLIAPLMLFDSIRPRAKFWIYSIVLVALTVGAVWVGNPVLRQRFQTAFANADTLDSRANSAAAWAAFQESPILGKGAGAVHYIDAPAQGGGAAAVSGLAHNGYAELLAQYGILGGILFLAPIFWMIFAIWRSWRAQPSRKVSSEASFRRLHHNIHGVQEDQPQETRKRRRVRKSKSASQRASREPVPLARILLTAFLLGLLAFFVHFYYESHLAFSATIIALLMALAAALAAAHFPLWRLTRRAYGVIGFSIAFLAAGALFALSLPIAKAQSFYYDGMGEIERVEAEQPSIDESLDRLAVAYEDLAFAVRLNPGHADAWAAMGKARVEQLEIAPFIDIDYQDQAVERLRHAIDIQPNAWRYWVDLGRALSLYHAPDEEIAAAFRRAVELAPENPEALFYLGDFLSANPMRRDEAMQAANRALEIAPNYAPAQSLRQRLLLMGAR